MADSLKHLNLQKEQIDALAGQGMQSADFLELVKYQIYVIKKTRLIYARISDRMNAIE